MRDQTDEHLSTLRTLYPWYKEEVYRHRQEMMHLAAFAGSFLLLVLLTLTALPSFSSVTPIGRGLMSTGVLLLAGLFLILILQQRARHRMAKQVLIEIERALGLYEEGLYLEDRTLYPLNWQTAWLSDRSIALYVLVLVGLSTLVIATIMLR